jgi:hypothetical protein
MSRKQYTATELNGIVFANAHLRERVDYFGSAFQQGDRLEITEFPWLEGSDQKALFHQFIQTSEAGEDCSYAIFSAVQDKHGNGATCQILRDALSLYEQHSASLENNTTLDCLLIPVVQLSRHFAQEDHIGLLVIKFVAENQMEAVFFDPKSSFFLRDKSIRVMKNCLDEFFSEKEKTFKVKALDHQSAFNDKDCGRYVAHYIDFLIEQEVGFEGSNINEFRMPNDANIKELNRAQRRATLKMNDFIERGSLEVEEMDEGELSRIIDNFFKIGEDNVEEEGYSSESDNNCGPS